MNDQPLLAGIELVHHYRDVTLLDRVNLSLGQGESIALVGRSGCGKTTLLNILSGLLRPNSGAVFSHAQEVTGQPGHGAYMQQRDLLLPWLSLLDNVSLPLKIAGMSRQERHRQARSHLEQFGLAGAESAYPPELSGGMRSRAALLRAYLHRNDLLLLDEPFAALDTITRSELGRWLARLVREQNTAMLLVTHDVNEARLLCDRVLRLERGRLQIDPSTGERATPSL